MQSLHAFFVMLVLEHFEVFMFMFPLSYKHPKDQADLHCVFMKPHIHSSTCGRTVAGGEEPSESDSVYTTNFMSHKCHGSTRLVSSLWSPFSIIHSYFYLQVSAQASCIKKRLTLSSSM